MSVLKFRLLLLFLVTGFALVSTPSLWSPLNISPAFANKSAKPAKKNVSRAQGKSKENARATASIPRQKEKSRFQVRWPRGTDPMRYPIPTGSGSVVRVFHDKKRVDTWVSRISSGQMVTKSAVDREWRELLKFQKDKTLLAKCQQTTPFYYTCDRLGKGSTGFTVTKLAWDSRGWKTLIKSDPVKDKRTANFLLSEIRFEPAK